MNDTNTGRPAFQLFMETGYSDMALRDHFAGLAMQGLLSDPNIKARPLDFAIRAYAMADAMIEYRSKEQ